MRFRESLYIFSKFVYIIGFNYCDIDDLCFLKAMEGVFVCK